MSLARRVAGELVLSGASLLLGLAVAAAIAAAFDAPPLEVLVSMLTSYRVLPDLVGEYTAMLILTGLAFALPLYTGLFNIGGEGSFYAGALAGLYVALATGSLPLAVAAGVAAGLVLTGAAGLLRVRLGVNEVLSTIMFNWIMYWLLLYIVITRLTDPTNPQRTLRVPEEASIPSLGPVPGTLPIALTVAVAAWVFLRMTRTGLLLRVVGGNPEAARLRGVPRARYMLASMALAGALAGLAGAIHVLGFSRSIDVLGGTVRNYGFNGIGVALMGRNDPLGIVAAAFLFSLLLAGSQVVEPLYGVPKEAADAIMGVIIIALAAPEAFRLASRILRR